MNQIALANGLIAGFPDQVRVGDRLAVGGLCDFQGTDSVYHRVYFAAPRVAAQLGESLGGPAG